MKNFKNIVFGGALWGILEATLGWALHLIHFKGEALILYPFGLMCMLMAFKQTLQLSSVMKVAMVASLIKLVNLFMVPVVPIYHVTNPAVAIALEGLVTWAFCVGYLKNKKPSWTVCIPVASVLVLASVFVFRGWQMIMDNFMENPSVRMPFETSMGFQWLWRSVVQGVMLFGVVSLSNKYTFKFNANQLVNRLAFPLLFIALLVTVLIK